VRSGICECDASQVHDLDARHHFKLCRWLVKLSRIRGPSFLFPLELDSLLESNKHFYRVPSAIKG
jgi:hypothetical protein